MLFCSWQEDLDDLLTRHHLLNEALGGGDRLLLADEVFRAAAADLLRDRDHGDDAEHEHQRQPKAEVEHDGEHHEHDRAGLNERGSACETSWRSVSMSFV